MADVIDLDFYRRFRIILQIPTPQSSRRSPLGGFQRSQWLRSRAPKQPLSSLSNLREP